MKLKYTPVDGIFRRRALSCVSILLSRGKTTSYCLILCYSCRGIRLFTCSSESVRSELPGENAYDILGVSETSSSDEIKASFRKLAKETHPDLAESRNDSDASQRFVQILAAYEVLIQYSYSLIIIFFHLINSCNLDSISNSFLSVEHVKPVWVIQYLWWIW